MEQSGQGIRVWLFASAALMVVGSFGPWVKALGISVSGTDGSNDGWFVLAAAVAGGAIFYTMRGRRAAGVWALLGGLAGLGITLHDRSHVQRAISHSGALGAALVQIGWGLNLALGASISMAVAAVIYLLTFQPVAVPMHVPSSPPPIATVPASPPPVLPTSPPE